MLVLLFTVACSKPFTPLPTALEECRGKGDTDAFHRCLYDKGWVFTGKGWEQVP